MTPQDKKEIAASFMEHMDREKLHTSEAARFLNLLPCYCSMVKSEKSWDSMTKTAWERFLEWFNTRCNIRDFQIPEGEEILKRKEKPQQEPKPEFKPLRQSIDDSDIALAADEHSPETALSNITEKEAEFVKEIKPAIEKAGRNIAKKQRNGKIVKLVINQGEMADLRQKIKFLEEEIIVLKAETISVLLQRIKDLETGMGHLVTIPKPENAPKIVIFQRNNYK
jgi:hypothetical protein